MDGIVIHPRTRSHAEAFVARPSHALLLTAPQGSGKQTLARVIIASLVGSDNVAAVDEYPYYRLVVPEKGKRSIGIEAVRDLQQFAKLRLPGEGSARRIIHIHEAQLLTTEAQNAILKLLEEPPAGTVFVLAADTEQQLRPTIRSRVQTMAVLKPARADTENFFSAAGFDAKDIAQAYMLSGGLPGLMTALLSDADHPLRQTVSLARQLLQTTQFERLAKVDMLSKDKTETLQLLFILQQMAAAAIEQTAARTAEGSDAADKPLRQWHKILRAAYEAEEAYAVSAQAKLTLTNLMLSL